MKAMEGWPTRKLRELADIRVSNVDKKFRASEKPVKLCNYMDVYANEYVTAKIQFMEASATRSEIERFGLIPGDVIITKDSETPDDIGIPTVIMEKIDDLVCGYHLALIRPNREHVDPIYLANQLSTSYVAQYFARKASGSTRFGLPIGAIETVEIPTPPKSEQTKIAQIFSTVDRTIEQTKALIAKHQRIKTGLMQDLLARGIDEHGDIRSKQTHEFKDSPLGKIPVDWDVCKLGNIGNWSSGGTPTKANPKYWGGEVAWISPKDMKTFDLQFTVKGLTKLGVRHGSKIMPSGTVFIVVRGMILAHTFRVCITSRPMAFNQDIKAIVVNPYIEPRFFAYWLLARETAFLKIATTATHGTKRFDMEELFEIDIGIPEMSEQVKIVKVLDVVQAQITANTKKKGKLRSLKAALMQDLLTGKKRVTALLNDAEMAAE